MIATMLVQANGSQPWYLCGYLLVAGFISTIATMWLGTIRERNDTRRTRQCSHGFCRGGNRRGGVSSLGLKHPSSRMAGSMPDPAMPSSFAPPGSKWPGGALPVCEGRRRARPADTFNMLSAPARYGQRAG